MNNRCANIGKFFWSTTTINNNNWENPKIRQFSITFVKYVF